MSGRQDVGNEKEDQGDHPSGGAPVPAEPGEGENRGREEAFPSAEDASALTVIGMGGSAGCLPALEAFFQNVSPNSGSAYVVVLHLSPVHESHLAEILGRSTSLPVQQVTDSVRLAADHVYVIPPGRHLEMHDGRLELGDSKTGVERRTAIDPLFRTLAASHGPQSAAIVFSGADADGTLGIRQIKEVGGLVVVQSPTEAEQDAMPRSAIATGLADYVLPAAAMPAQIAAYWETSRRMRIPGEAAPSPEQQQEGADQEVARHEILTRVRVQTGHDFAFYKRATLLRRIGRRMQVNGLETLQEYQDFLSSRPAEVGDLITDLLISVTQFFRDPAAWRAVEQDIIPRLFDKKTPNDDIRVWVCGCATGEEVYTLAILLLERAEKLPSPPRIQIFATDMDPEAIARARAGLYPETIVADVSEERLRRWFYWQNGVYQVRKEVRETALFAHHDLLRDTPFSRLDLITCRNLLIYLNRDAQERVFHTFHFALRPDGYLVLGPSESADIADGLFALLDKQHRLYIRQPRPGSITPLSPSSLLPLATGRIPTSYGEARDLLSVPRSPRNEHGGEVGGELAGVVPPSGTANSGSDSQALFRTLMDRLGPQIVLIDAEYDIVHMSGGLSRFLHMPAGMPTFNLLQLAPNPLRSGLRAALFAAATEGRQQVRAAQTETAGAVRLTVRPVALPTKQDTISALRYFLVQFEEASDDGAPPAATEAASHLEQENEMLQRQLRSTVEQYDAQAEALRASNEELQASNEEMRSVAEELETSREELQSVNAELATVNHELKVRVEELSIINSDLSNFLSSTQIAILFLDRALRIKRYTPAAESLFHLIPTDSGRPLAHLTNRLDYPTLIKDVETVLARLVPIEREVSRRDGERYYLARLLPYRSLEDRIEGVIATFVDITDRKRAEEVMRTLLAAREESEERFRLLVEGATDYAMFLLDRDGRVTFWSTGAERIFGWREEEMRGEPAETVFTPEDRRERMPQREMGIALAQGRSEDRRWHLRKDGSRFWADGVLMRLNDESGQVRGFAKILRDATEQKRSEEALEQALNAVAESNLTLEARVQERTAELAEMSEMRRELLRQLVTAQEAERARISRDLHDDTGQQITALLLGLGNLKNSSGYATDESAQQLITHLQELAGDVAKKSHRLSFTLRPTVLDDIGLMGALQNYAEEWSRWSGLPVDIESVGLGSETRLSSEIETTIYRVVQEALTNALRYAAPTATQVSILVQRRDGVAGAGAEILTVIEDNGPGFDVEEVLNRPPGQRRLGIFGMQERARLAGGTLEIESTSGEGTTVYLRLPLPPHQDDTTDDTMIEQ